MAISKTEVTRLVDAMDVSYRDLEPFRKHTLEAVRQYCGRHYGKNEAVPQTYPRSRSSILRPALRQERRRNSSSPGELPSVRDCNLRAEDRGEHPQMADPDRAHRAC